MHFFCPSCWNEVNEKETICPSCKAKLGILDNEPFKNKLLRALNHSEPQTVLRAIQILGEKQLPETIPYLKEKFLKSDNPYVQEALIDALCKFCNPAVKDFIMRYASEEYSVIVRKAIKNCLKSYDSQT
jgi:HEAT repeat protein